MSLVAYAASSSDEESDCDDYMGQVYSLTKTKRQDQTDTTKLAGEISDDDENDFAPVEVPLEGLKQLTGCGLALPIPKNANAIKEFKDKLMANLDNLPLPKPSKVGKEEDDDEFLRKKVEPQDVLKVEKRIKGPVKIYLTSLQEFSDVDKVVPTSKPMLNAATTYSKNPSGLLSILPLAKSEQVFTKVSSFEDKQMVRNVTPFKELPFVPDTVRSGRSALNTESIDRIKAASKHMNAGTATARPVLVDCSDSEDSGDEDRATKQSDFFSLAKEEKLPEVSANEISAMVAQRAAKMAQATKNYLHAASTRPSGTAVATSINEGENDCEEKQHCQTQMDKNVQPLDTNAMQALIGSRAKRVRRHKEDINVMDISSDQVLPNREEWMRSALASSTTYQPTGVLVDEEPATGTRRKHQITYLAHKAKANEAELQAMWAVNRQNRRATQSKYGF